jgi:hypothetical protein
LGGTLLIPGARASSREWIRENLRGRDLLWLDPGESPSGPPARLCLLQAEKTTAWRFMGGLSAARAPHLLLAGAVHLSQRAGRDWVAVSPHYAPSPLMRQVTRLLAECLSPENIFIDETAEIDLAGWPVTPEEVALGEAPPASVLSAQRRAQWLLLFSEAQRHELPFSRLTIEGARLGSGTPFPPAARQQIGLTEALHAEVCGSTLLAISERPLDDEVVSRALNATQRSRAHLSHPDAYRRRICAFVRDDGENFGLGVIEEIDFRMDRVAVVADAEPPAPAACLRIGRLKVDADGREIEECRPWDV